MKDKTIKSFQTNSAPSISGNGNYRPCISISGLQQRNLIGWENLKNIIRCHELLLQYLANATHQTYQGWDLHRCRKLRCDEQLL